jgi:hypothetical protein
VSAFAQLALFAADGQSDLDAPENNDRDTVLEAARRLVAEPGMSEDDVRAVVADALHEHGRC